VDAFGESATAAANLLNVAVSTGSLLDRRRPSSFGHNERLAVYGQFHRSVWAMVYAQQLVRSMVPGIIGGAWTLPAQGRRLQSIDETSRDMLLAFADVRMIGSPDCRAAAVDVTIELAKLANVATPSKNHQIEALKSEMQPILNQIGDSLSHFIDEARSDLLSKPGGKRRFWIGRSRRNGEIPESR
jgi:hypothetical protein